jgi:hypothetical protein
MTALICTQCPCPADRVAIAREAGHAVAFGICARHEWQSAWLDQHCRYCDAPLAVDGWCSDTMCAGQRRPE